MLTKRQKTSHLLQIRLTEADYKTLITAAKSERLLLTTWARKELLPRAEQVTSPNELPQKR